MKLAPLTELCGESLVLAADAPSALAFMPDPAYPLSVRNSYLDHLPTTIHYQPNQDYIFDATSGAIRRTAQSRIPDFTRHVFFGQDNFIEKNVADFSNLPYFVYVDYRLSKQEVWPRQSDQISLLAKTHKKLIAGDAVKIIAFGDSITAGGETSEPALIYWERWLQSLRAKYPHAALTGVNSATGGANTQAALNLLDADVLNLNPDLVLIGFGMNDHNHPDFGGVAPDRFKENLHKTIDLVRARTAAEIILISAFDPNPKWHFGTGRMATYAEATESVARETRCAYADVYNNWRVLAARKNPEDLLANNINHPNDFGHWIYFRVLAAIGL